MHTNNSITPVNALASTTLPKRLIIPALAIDAPIREVGITKGGTMGVPALPSDVGWFNLGTPPGEIGSAVIDGHSGWRGGIPAVFDNLGKLKIGDRIYIEDEYGIRTTFIVRFTRIYQWNEDVPDVFLSFDNKAHLNLITCTGFWNKTQKTHSSRLVVFTDKEEILRNK